MLLWCFIESKKSKEKQRNGLQDQHRLHHGHSSLFLHFDLCCPAGASLRWCNSDGDSIRGIYVSFSSTCLWFIGLFLILFVLDFLKDNAEAETVEVEVDKSCEGVGEDECLTRRTLAAQIDYIYTQKHKPWNLTFSWLVLHLYMGGFLVSFPQISPSQYCIFTWFECCVNKSGRRCCSGLLIYFWLLEFLLKVVQSCYFLQARPKQLLCAHNRADYQSILV